MITLPAWLIGLIVLTWTTVLSPLAWAQEQKQGAWEWSVAPYLWGTGIDGTIGVRGHETSVNADFGDLVDFVNAAAALHVEAMNKNRWGFYTEVFYVSLGNETTTATGEIDSNAYQTIADAAAMYRIKPPLDLYFGARYQRVSTNISFPILGRFSQAEDWTDFIVGARYAPKLSKRWQLVLRGDVGTGDSDSTWLAQILGVYQFTKHWSVAGGYRYLNTDFENNGFTWDMAEKGVGIAFAYRSSSGG